MKSFTKSDAPDAEFAYYRQRHQNRVFTRLVEFITGEAQRHNITKKEMAERLGKDPGQLSRLLSHPSNLTLDTISDLLLVLGAEAEPPEIIKFSERQNANYMHPLVSRIIHADGIKTEKRKSIPAPKNNEKAPEIRGYVEVKSRDEPQITLMAAE